MKDKRTYIIIGVICFLLFFMMTLQIRTIKKSESDILMMKKENELRDEINQWKDLYDNATDKIDELNTRISEYQNAATKKNETVGVLKTEIDSLNSLAGLTDLKGKGIMVVLDDTKAIEQIALDAGFYDPNVYVIHDSDILMIINELKAAGAEAISVNGQRIIANTEIRCVGPVVSINNVRLTAPFEISVIGDSVSLSNSLKLRGGIVEQLEEANIDVTVEKREEIFVPKIEKAIEYKYATPAEEGVN